MMWKSRKWVRAYRRARKTLVTSIRRRWVRTTFRGFGLIGIPQFEWVFDGSVTHAEHQSAGRYVLE